MKIGFTSDERDAIIPESKTGRMWWIDEGGGGGRPDFGVVSDTQIVFRSNSSYYKKVLVYY